VVVQKRDPGTTCALGSGVAGAGTAVRMIVDDVRDADVVEGSCQRAGRGAAGVVDDDDLEVSFRLSPYALQGHAQEVVAISGGDHDGEERVRWTRWRRRHVGAPGRWRRSARGTDEPQSRLWCAPRSRTRSHATRFAAGVPGRPGAGDDRSVGASPAARRTLATGDACP